QKHLHLLKHFCFHANNHMNNHTINIVNSYLTLILIFLLDNTMFTSMNISIVYFSAVTLQILFLTNEYSPMESFLLSYQMQFRYRMDKSNALDFITSEMFVLYSTSNKLPLYTFTLNFGQTRCFSLNCGWTYLSARKKKNLVRRNFVGPIFICY
ncbi:hypothetical protein L9F63_018550, partial [Diploptera punctata]